MYVIYIFMSSMDVPCFSDNFCDNAMNSELTSSKSEENDIRYFKLVYNENIKGRFSGKKSKQVSKNYKD